MLTREPIVVNIVEDIYIMNQDGGIVMKQVLCLLQSPTRLQQFGSLIAKLHHRCIVLLSHMIDDLLGKVMNVDYEAVVSLIHQSMDVQVEQRSAANRNQSFGHGVGQGLQTRAQTCRQNHCLSHILCFELQNYKKNINNDTLRIKKIVILQHETLCITYNRYAQRSINYLCR